MLNKNTIRTALLQLRATLQQKTIDEHSTRICNQLKNLPVFQQSQHIGLYWPIPGEIDTHLIMTMCWKLKKCCYLPKIASHFQMDFCLYDQTTQLQMNSFSTQEPLDSEIISPTRLELVLVPLIAFDALGHRLGFGAGYYDRYFAFRKKQLQLKPFLIGLAHSFQEVNEIPVDTWDVNLDMVLTEKNLLRYTAL